MKKNLLLFVLFLSLAKVWAQSEPSTYFNLYVPPNNDAVKRNVALIVTAIADSTVFTIEDDAMDNDSDDNVSGMLMAGQSYILYIKDNGINDDAQYASGGVLTRDGDYFIIKSSQLIYASMSTDSDWEHDFVPSTNKKSVGQKFIVYSPKVTSSLRDLNVFAYADSTTISIYKISTIPTTQTGYTNINWDTKQLVVQQNLKPGQDIIHYFTNGRDIMETGATYLIESNKDVSVQYGALWGNARDGGAYVPSLNGSASGELFYFAVPYQTNGEQEIRMFSWDDNNTVRLEYYSNNTWLTLSSKVLNKLGVTDWVGKQNGNATYPTVFRVTCNAGKRVSVMEANWMETGATNTSDMSTMLSSESGTSSGTKFVAYMLPPSKENNVINPFTKTFFIDNITHFYLYAGNKNTTVTIKDVKTNGLVLNKTYAIKAGRYADAFFTMNEWKSIYNGTGAATGAERPYVIIEATEHISVLSINFNDNWLNYFGTSLPQSFEQLGSVSKPTVQPGEQITFISKIDVDATDTIKNANIAVTIGSGLIPINTTLYNNGSKVEVGNITSTENESTAHFTSVNKINPNDNYEIQTKAQVSPNYNNGKPIPNEAILNTETTVSGNVNGEFQQSVFCQGIKNNSSNTSLLMFSNCHTSTVGNGNNNSWNASWIDYNQDGWEDLFIPSKEGNAKNQLYKNNGNGSFTAVSSNTIVDAKAKTAAAVWGDVNNDGYPEVLLVNATLQKTSLYLNSNGQFAPIANSGIDIDPQYFHGAAFADFDNDGYLDIIITNFFETRFHQLYKNNGNNTFTRITNTPITTVTERAMAPILADYNNDGLVDLFIPNGDNKANSLFKNKGSFQFEQILTGDIVADKKNSVGAAWGDYNNDGFMDLVVVNASNQKNDLYKNNGNGSFSKQTNSIVSNEGGQSHSASWVDVNNDGFLDLYITNDIGSSMLYLNDKKGGFNCKIDELVSGQTGKAFGAAWADYNKDGQMDVAIATHTTGATRFFCNNGNANKWIGFNLQGTFSNKMAIGATVSVKCNGTWQHRQLLPVTGFGSQNSPKLHFGLGTATAVDSVLIKWPSGINQIVTSYKINSYNSVIETGGKKVLGVVFNDVNNNGLKEVNEELIPNVRFQINDSKNICATDHEGSFITRTTQKQMSISILDNQWLLAPKYATFAVNADSVMVAIPLVAVLTGYDLETNFATTAWRRGFKNETILQVKNKGTSNACNVHLEMAYPTHLFIKSASSSYTANGNNKFEWLIDTLQAGEVKSIAIVDSVGLNAVTGQILELSAKTWAKGTDIDTTNNHTKEQIEIVGAIDPNDILVSPKGDGEAGYINNSQWLTYTIRFENIGTYAATYVFLENQLPLGLDKSTFQVLSSSHSYTYSLNAEGLLKVNYIDINLPTLASDSLKAQGYFKYKIRPFSNIQGGTELPNSARIKFDFETEIPTNEVMNTIKYNGNNAFKNLIIYPNPATDKISVMLDKEYFKTDNPLRISNWSVLEPSGREVLTGEVNNDMYVNIDVEKLKPGIYIIKAKDISGFSYSGRLVKQ